MSIMTYHINETGLRHLREFLAENHKLGREFTLEMLYAWASPAEDAMQEGLTPTVEIGAHDAILGAAITLGMDDLDFDAVEEPTA